MLKALKRIFNVTLFLGVIFSFFLRCSSQPKVVSQAEETVSVPEEAPEIQRRHKIQSRVEDPVKGVRPDQSVADFKAQTEKILKDLPTIDEIRRNRKNEDYHDTPKAILAAGKPMGQVRAKMLSNPVYVDTGLKFYENCALDREIVVQVKALCLRNLRDWEERLGRVSDVDFPIDVERLASQLTKTKF